MEIAPVPLDEAIAAMRAASISEEEIEDFLNNGVGNAELSDSFEALPLFVTLRGGKWVYAVTERIPNGEVRVLRWTVEGLKDDVFATLPEALAAADAGRG